MTNEEFLRDVCPNHTESSRWNKSELLHILELHKEQLRLAAVSKRSIPNNGEQMLIDILENKYVQNTITKEMINKIKHKIRNPDSWKDVKNGC